MLLINPTFKIENPDIIRDKKGRFLLVRASLRDEEFCFANIYAPNDPSLQKTFFNELSNKLQPHSNDNLILGGDFNCLLESVDKTGGKDLNNRRSVIDSINDLRNTLGLVDIWRLHHPSSQRFTWSNSSGKIQCRLDYWLVSKHLVPRTCKTEVKHTTIRIIPQFMSKFSTKIHRKNQVQGFGNLTIPSSKMRNLS